MKEKYPVGRRLIKFTDDMIKEVELLSGRGLTQRQIASYFGISYSCFCYKMLDHEEIRRAFYRGKAKTISFVAGKLIEQIKDGSTSATIFYLKTQAGWVDPNASANKSQRDEDVDYDEDNDRQKLRIDTNDPNEAAKMYQQIMFGDKNE